MSGRRYAPADQIAPTPGAPARAGGEARALVRAMRPRQWVKNVLVAAVPAAAGEIGDLEVLAQTALAFVAFCLASSATYLVNDLADRTADRAHPVKHKRPIASGALSARTAVVAAVVAAVAAIALAAVASLPLAGGVAGYLALTAAYTGGLKHEPVFDIATVAAGFFLRAVAGGLATGLDVSRWFLIVAAGASLFVVAGKRYAESVRATAAGTPSRRVLAHYSPGYLQSVFTIAAAVTVVAYCLWAFEDSGDVATGWRAASVAPFVLAIMRYGLLLDQGHGEEPEELLLGDRVLVGVGVCWVALLMAGVLL